MAQDNGIAVGKPKIYDNRSLTIMLNQLNASLATTMFIDPASLAAALSYYQGTEVQSVYRSLSVGLTPPGSAGASSLAATSGGSGPGGTASGGSGSSGAGSGGSGTGGGGAGGSGSGVGGGSGSGSSGTGAGSGSGGGSGSGSGASTLPAGIQNILSNAAFSPQYGASASDLLSDQTNLTYQIFNLRMLLERSLSDRLIQDRPRLQAVLGFNVSIDPDFAERDSAAIVEITIDQPGVELVSMMPQEKTYNTAALRTSDKAFSGSAVVKMITLNTARQKRSQVFYLYRDNDTLSFQRMVPGENEGEDKADKKEKGSQADRALHFGWEFRPVLGRRSVAPGMRQLFAIVSLPSSDLPFDGPESLRVRVRTFWHRYDHSTLTTYYRKSLAKTVAMAVSPSNWFLGVRHANFRADEVTVPSSSAVERDLGAVVEDVRWIPTDANDGTIVVKGRNFFTGTTVTLGTQTYAEGSGLTIQSDQTMVLMATLQQVALADGVVSGRYGAPVALAPQTRPAGQAMQINGVKLEPGPLYTTVRIQLSRRSGLLLDSLPLKSPVIVYNDALLPGRPQAYPDPDSPGVIHVATVVPTAALGDFNGLFAVKFPLAGAAFAAKAQVHDVPPPVITRTDIDSRSTLTLTNVASVNGRVGTFDGPWQLILDQAYVADQADPRQPHSVSLVRLVPCGMKEPTCHILQLTVDKSILDAYKTLVLISPDGVPRTYPVPPAANAAPPGKPALDAKQPGAVVKQGQTAWIKLTGQSLDSIKLVVFNPPAGPNLTFTASADGKSLSVYVTSDVTKTSGPQSILLEADAQTMIAATVNILAVAGADNTNKGANNAPRK